MKALASLLLFTWLFAGCVTERLTPSFPSNAAVGGPPFELYSPAVIEKDPNTKRPLVVVLHGCLQTGEAMSQLTKMNDEADRAGFFVMYPEQVKGKHPMNCWAWFDPANRKTGGGELQTIMKMIDDVKSKHPIDPSRIYISGLSAGAATAANLLACYPQAFAGGALIASPAFGIASNERDAQLAMGASPAKKRGTKESCQPSQFQGRLLIMAGSKDRAVQPLHSALLSEQFTSAQERNGKRLSSMKLIYPGELDYQMVCFGNPARVCRVEVQGVEHAWSGGALYPFSEPRGPSTSEFIRRFVIESEMPAKVNKL